MRRHRRLLGKTDMLSEVGMGTKHAWAALFAVLGALLHCGVATAQPVLLGPGQIINPTDAQRLHADPLVVPGRYRMATFDLAAALRSIHQGSPLVFNLFSDFEARGHVQSRKMLEGGSSFVAGSLDDGGHFTLFLHRSGVIRGEVHSADGLYSLKSRGEDASQVLVRQLDLSSLPEHRHEEFLTHKKEDSAHVHSEGHHSHSIVPKHKHTSASQAGASGKAATQGSSNNSMDVLVLYTQHVEDSEFGPEGVAATIENEVAKMNQVLENSGLSHRKVRLAGMAKVKYKEADSIYTDFDNLSERRPKNNLTYGLSDEVHSLIEKHRPDMIHFLVTGGPRGACGLAGKYTLNSERHVQKECENASDQSLCLYNKRREYWRSSRGIFAVTALTCLENYTFSHETAHNLGLWHTRNPALFEDYEDMLNNGPFRPYAFGYINVDFYEISDGICQMTIMSGSGAFRDCTKRGSYTIPYFSNPDLFFPPLPLVHSSVYPDFDLKTPMGIPGDEYDLGFYGPTNAARAIDEAWDIVAGLSDLDVRNPIASCNEGDITSNTLSLFSGEVEMAAGGGGKDIMLSFSVPDNCAGVSLITSSSTSEVKTYAHKIREGEFQLSITAGAHNSSCDPRLSTVTVELTGVYGVSPASVVVKQTSNNELCTSVVAEWPADSLSLDLSGQVGSGSRRLVGGLFSKFAQSTQLNLSYNQLRGLPNGLLDGLSQLRELNLSRNELKSLPASLFAQTPEVTHLWLHANSLDSDSLSKGAFSNLTELRTLDLSENKLGGLKEGWFATLTKLENLWLWRNRLGYLYAETFSSLSGLRTLSLSGNALFTIEDNTFAGLGSLEELWLLNNEIEELSERSFAGLGSVRFLSLSGNQLRELPSGVFSDLSSLESLWLRNNQLADIESDAFSGLASLRFLDLSGNPLTNPLPSGVCEFLSSVEELRIDGINLDLVCPN